MSLFFDQDLDPKSKSELQAECTSLIGKTKPLMPIQCSSALVTAKTWEDTSCFIDSKYRTIRCVYINQFSVHSLL